MAFGRIAVLSEGKKRRQKNFPPFYAADDVLNQNNQWIVDGLSPPLGYED
jgi:hypothetical protein